MKIFSQQRDDSPTDTGSGADVSSTARLCQNFSVFKGGLSAQDDLADSAFYLPAFKGSPAAACECLTGFDLTALVDRGLWAGREVVDVNVRCKALWHEGKSVTDAAKILKRSESWTEKRYGAFRAALSGE